MNFVAILFERVKGSDLVLLQLFLCQLNLLVPQFCQVARFPDRVGFMLVFRNVVGKAVLRGEWSASPSAAITAIRILNAVFI